MAKVRDKSINAALQEENRLLRQQLGNAGQKNLLLEYLIENSQDIIAGLNKEGRVIFVSPSIEKTLGYKPHERIGKLSQDIIHPDDLAIVAQLRDGVSEDAKQFKVQYRLRHKEGHWVTVETSVIATSQIEGTVVLLSSRDLSRRLKSHRELSDLESNFSQIFNASPDLLSISDLEDSTYYAVNDTWLKFHHRTREDVIGKDASQLGIWVKPYDRQKFVDDLRQKGFIENIEIQIGSEHAPARTFISYGEIIIFNDKRCCFTVSMDITERKENEDKLRQSEIWLQTLFNTSPALTTVSNLKTSELLHVNDAWLKGYGYTRDEVIGKRAIDLNLWVNVSDRNRFVENLSRNGFVRDMEIPFHCNDGTIKTVLYSGDIIHMDGQARLHAVAVDITERKEKDRELELYRDHLKGLVKERTAELEKSRELFREFAENAVDWLWETDANLQFTQLSGNFEDVLGILKEDIIGNTWQEILVRSQDNLSPEWQQHLQEINDHLHYRVVEVVWTKPDGNSRHISLSGSPRFDDKGTFVGYLGAGRDVTYNRHLEEQVRRAQKMKAVGQLTGGIAHDFNNILGIVQGNLELLEDIVFDNESALERVKKAQNGVMRGTDITRKLLGFSSKQAGEVRVTPINTFIKNIEELIARSLTASINVETHIDEDLWSAAVDPGDLEDALLNLSLNARDAMPDGGTLSIETANKVFDEGNIRLHPEIHAGEYVMISVSDTGVGMTADIKDKVLEPFFTTKEQGKGTGLGLSMVYGFVQRSNGHLNIYSELGKGTTVHLFLPRSENSDADTSINDSKIADLPKGNETILIVDDEEGLRDVTASYLKMLGYSTIVAENADQAIVILGNNRDIDLLFSDVVMPGGVDGYQLASMAHENWPALKILLTSGFTKKVEALSQSDDKYLIELNEQLLGKPYNISKLALALRKAIKT
ncbi:MAG: PAS domain S-box protein [Sneathiella sp.]|nr:PAS domain S-box protein [Sneathiella sp.]